MQAGSPEWQAILAKGASEAGVRLEPIHLELMGRHAQALLEWNRTTNLTAITDPVEMAVKHFLDAIIPSPHIPSEGPLLDIGTGGGFPGIPLKILRPDQPMTLIDGARRKINFVKHVLRSLGLKKIEAIQTRAELMAGRPENQGRFQAVIGRAVSDLPAMVRLAHPFLSSQGKLFLFQGPSDTPRRMAQGAALELGMKPVGLIDYRLPMLGDKRTLVVLARIENPE
jgi:16S rRNA (guanine527-N7)-methyltransferase